MSVTAETRSEVIFFPSRRSIERLEEKSFVVLDVAEATGRPRLVAALHVAPNPRNGLFVNNNPVNWVDPMGLFMEGPVGGALARAAAGAAVGAGAGALIGGVGAGPGAIIGAVAGLLLTTPSTAHAPTMMDQPRPFVDPQEWMGPLNSAQRRFRQDEDDCLKSLEKFEEMCSSPLSQQEKDDFMRNCMEGKGHTYP
jgi:hypothetical protein